MNYKYLLDTNIISNLVKRPTGIIFQQITEIGEEKICTNIIVDCELRFGIRKSGSIKLAKQLEQILNTIDILPLETPCETYYAQIRTHLEQAGTPIGPNDLLIAAHALTLNLTVVTANIREFSRVPNLKVENWLEN
ncbi:type II toxin-antitoxin system VapC family toxin [Candidatus Halobeggiatoa sp. HSG11]|nr:type II toxin-antitoxin system VapC family toxin [Candidatus Halobeggiatoa sp. HSG11]